MQPDRTHHAAVLTTLACLLAGGCAAHAGSHAAPPSAIHLPALEAPPGGSAPDQVHLTVTAPTSPVGSGAAASPADPVRPADESEIVVNAPRITSESDPVGMYGQPEWTTRRRFARSRVYVLPEGQWEFEQWWRGTFDHGEDPSHLFQTEIGVGLPHRFQLDLYGNTVHEDSRTVWSGIQPELRWAPADWGVIPLNPTLYLEYKWQHHANDVAEGKVLLGDDLAPGTHWAMNLSCEQEIGGAKEQELAVTQAISWSLADRQFGVGLEFEVDRVTEHGGRDDEEWQFYAGPSIQWRPTPETHLDIVPFRGWHDAHDWRVFVVFGIDFGGRKERSGPDAPVSAKSR